MVYKYNVISHGVFYPAGTDVPVGDTPKAKEEVKEPVVDTTEVIEESPNKARKYSADRIKKMKKGELDEVAKELGISGNFKSKVDLVTEILRMQGE